MTCKEFVDQVAGEIKNIWDMMNTSYDKFIRTTDEDHERQVQKIFRKLYEKGDIYKGYYVFHAGTALKDGKIVTNGGRVLGVTAKGADLKEARKNAYEATEWIQFENKYMRHDIGKAIDEA